MVQEVSVVWDVPTVQEVPMGAGAGTQHSADDKEEGGAQGSSQSPQM